MDAAFVALLVLAALIIAAGALLVAYRLSGIQERRA